MDVVVGVIEVFVYLQGMIIGILFVVSGKKFIFDIREFIIGIVMDISGVGYCIV